MELEKKLVNAAKWSLAGKISSQLVNWCFTFLTIRLLTPDDYGLFAVIMATIALFTLLNEFGLGAAIVQTKSINVTQLKSANGVIIIVNMTIFIVVYSLASPIAHFFNESRLAGLLQLIAFQFVVGALTVVPRAILIRNISFKNKEIIFATKALTNAVSTYLFALNGYGVWSLIYGSLIATVINAIMLNIAIKTFYWPSFNIQPIKHLFTYGGNMLAQRTIWWLYTQADIIILKKLFSTTLVGVFFTAKNLASMPQDKLGAILNDIVLTGFSKIKDDKEAVKRHTLRLLGMLAMLVFPIYYGIAATSELLIPLVIGEQWSAAIYPLFLLCLIYPLRMLNIPIAEVLNAIGLPKVNTFGQVINCLTMLIAIAVGAQFGIIGVCFAWIIGYLIAFCIYNILAARHTGITLWLIFKTITPALISSAIMVVAVKYYYANIWTTVNVLGLLSGIAIGAIIYLGAILILNKQACFDLIELVKK